MIKKLFFISLLPNLAVGGYFYYNYLETHKTTVSLINSDSSAEEQLRAITIKEEESQRLGQYAINAMYQAGAQKTLSDAKKQILARAIVRVANDIFESEDNKKAFVAVIAIESGFKRFAQSPTGPKGLTQVAKGTFYEAMASCGVTDLHEEDVWETDINLYAGACYFKKVLDLHKGDPYMAIVAYNQGPNSESVKTYSKNGSLDNIEALKYVAKFSFIKRNLSDLKQPNIPAIEDLPKPSNKNKTNQ